MNGKRDLLTVACLPVGLAFVSAGGAAGVLGVVLTGLALLAGADSLHRRFGRVDTETDLDPDVGHAG